MRRFTKDGRLVRPFSESANVVCGGCSSPLERRTTDFGADDSFARASAKIREHCGIEIPTGRVRGVTEKYALEIKENTDLKTQIPEYEGVGISFNIFLCSGLFSINITKVMKNKENISNPGSAMFVRTTPSDARNPDLDWSQVRETVLMLNLAVSHIEKTMKDGDESVNALAQTFTSIMENVQAIGKATENLPNIREKKEIKNNYRDASEKVREAVIAFQFYDKLAQRLTHIGDSLALLGDLLANPGRLYNPDEWCGLQRLIKSNYRIDSDRAMFDAILSGATVQEALKITSTRKESDAEDDNVELF